MIELGTPELDDATDVEFCSDEFLDATRQIGEVIGNWLVRTDAMPAFGKGGVVMPGKIDEASGRAWIASGNIGLSLGDGGSGGIGSEDA